MIPNTTISVHVITKLTATAPNSYGAPLVLTCERGKNDCTEITLYLDDQGLVDRLVEAINTIYTNRSEPPQAACPMEAAAYQAEQDAYRWSEL